MEQDARFYSDLLKRTGLDFVTTLENLNHMSQAILDTPQLLEDAERAD